MINLKDSVVGGGGADTARATVDFVLPGDVENLTLNGKWSSVFGVANNLANIVVAETNRITLNALGGDDVIVNASVGANTFIFEPGSGKDVLYNFHSGAGNTDTVRLEGYGAFTQFADVTAAMTQVGADVLLKLSASDLILFKNTTVGAFNAGDFQLSINPATLNQTFNEDFNSFALQSQGGVWKPSYGWDSYNNLGAHTIPGEEELYVDPSFKGLGLNPFSVSNGVLSITAAKIPTNLQSQLWNYDYTSGLITTQGKFAQTYGYFEMRADIPEGQGFFPAFWLVPADNSYDSEIDIMETVDEPNVVHNTVHYRTAPGSAWSDQSLANYVTDLAGGFHTFGVLWNAQTITWYVDRVQVAQVATPAMANKPMYMLANLAVGGPWAGAADATTPFPSALKIDYIKAWSLAAAPVTPTPPTPPTPTSNAGDDTFAAATGAQTMIGGAGDDLYYVNDPRDSVVEAAGQGQDDVQSTVSFTLTGNVENLILAQWSNINGTGNALDNVITGNSGANILTGLAGDDYLDSGGGAGVDTLIGGTGDDVYVHMNASTVVTELAGEGIDTVITSVGYTLPANVENLTLRWSTSVPGTGNNLANVITGNTGANLLKGLAGNDTVFGMNGNDTLIGGAGNDSLTGGAGLDHFRLAPGDGDDVIGDFGNGGAEVLDLSAYLAAGLKPTMSTVNGDVLLSYSTGDSIILVGVSPGELVATSLGYAHI